MLRVHLFSFIFFVFSCSLGFAVTEHGLAYTFKSFGEITEVKSFIEGNTLKDLHLDPTEGEVRQIRFTALGMKLHNSSSKMVERIAKDYSQEVQVMVNTDKAMQVKMRVVLAEENVPERMIYLAHTMSGLNPLAVSKDGRAGIWMLPYHVAAGCGCRMTRYIDERIGRDIESQTRCAARYLKGLKKTYGTWEIAAQAYIHGPASISRGITRSGGYENLLKADSLLPKQWRESFYVYQALTYLATYRTEIGVANLVVNFNLESSSNTLLIPDQLYMEPLEKVFGIKQSEIKRMNPELRLDVIPKGYSLRLNNSDLDKLEASCDSIFHYQDSVYIRTKKKYYIANKERIISERKVFKRPDGVAKLIYKVKSGDNLGFIADWFDVKVSNVQFWNGIRGTRITAGQGLVIYVPIPREEYYAQVDHLSFKEKQALNGKTIKPAPKKPKSTTKAGSKGTSKKPKPAPKNPRAKAKFKKGVSYVTYTVKSGDNLWLIAKKYPGVSSQNIMDLNGIDTNLKPGQVLKIKEK